MKFTLPLIALLLTALLGSTAAHAAATRDPNALEIGLFPLVYKAQDAGQETSEFNAAWPLLLGQRSTQQEGDWMMALHPLFSAGTANGGTHHYWDFIYPLAGRRSFQDAATSDSLTRTWALPIYFNKSSRNGQRQIDRTVWFPLVYSGGRQPQGSRYFIFFPFYWDIDPGATYFFPIYDPQAGGSWALWPLWGRFRQLFGADELKFMLWPLWIKSYKGPDHTQTILWPIFSRTTGPTTHAWRVWPLWSTKTKEGKGTSTSYLWPLGYHIRRQAAGPQPQFNLDAFLPLFFHSQMGDYKIRYYFPFYGSATQPSQKTRAWLWPLVTHTTHTDPDWTQTRILYFLVNIIRGDHPEKTVVFPLFGERDDPDRQWSFFAYPFVHKRADEKQTGQHFTRQYFFPLYLNEKWVDKEGNLIKQRRALLPFFRSIKRGDGSSESSWLHLWWYTELPGMLRNWAPLWTFYSQRNDGQGTQERRVFWRLWHTRTVEGIGVEREVNFLVGRYHKPLEDTGQWSLLGLINWGGCDQTEQEAPAAPDNPVLTDAAQETH